MIVLPKRPWAVRSCLDPPLEGEVPVLGAPGVAGADPEHLLGAELGEAGQPRLLAVPLHPAAVGLVGLLDAAVVGDVLALGVDAVEVDVDGLGGVVAVLPDDALGLGEVVLLSLGLPPLGEVTLTRQVVHFSGLD